MGAASERIGSGRDANRYISHDGWEPGGRILRFATSRHVLVALSILVLLPTSALAEEGYYARVGVQPAEAPAEREGYDCAGGASSRPGTLEDSATFLAGQSDPQPIVQGDTHSPQPLVPTCYAVGHSVTVDPLISADGCERACVQRHGPEAASPATGLVTTSTAAGVYASFNMTSGKYVLDLYEWDEKSGKGPVTVELDCIECPPPGLGE